MNTTEQSWHELKATFTKTSHMTWDDAITQHTERDWHESRNHTMLRREERGTKQKRNGGYRRKLKGTK